MTRLWPYLVAAAVAAGLHLGGKLESLDYGLMDTRFGLVQRPASDAVMLVEIDARSLQELPNWPWSRATHARVIDNLRRAGAKRIAYDIDFSAPLDAAGDARLARALRSVTPPAILPAFKQLSPAPGGVLQTIHTAPLDRFRRHAAIGSVNVRPDSDGLIRRFDARTDWMDLRIPSLAAALTEQPEQGSDTFYLDFGIGLGNIERLSFIDVMRGDFSPGDVAGRRILVGATAIELRDYLSVPLYRSMPGPMLQLLAFESLTQGRAIARLGGWPMLLAVLMVALGLGIALERLKWRGGLTLCGGLAVGAFGASVAVQHLAPMSIDLAAFLVMTALCCFASVVRKIERLDLMIVLQSMTIRRKNAFMKGVVDHSFDGIITVDSEGIVLSFNAAAERMFARDSEHSVGRNAGFIFRTEAEAGPDRDPEILCREYGAPTEVLGERSDGSSFPMSVVVSRMPFREQDYYVVVTRDISAEKAAQGERDRAQMQLQEAVANIPEGFVLFDADGRFVMCNQRYRDLYFGVAELLVPGQRREEILRVHAAQGYVLASSVDPEEWLRERLSQAREPRLKCEQQRADGSWVKINERRTHDGGVVGIHTDITELKRREADLQTAKVQAEAASRAKSDFLAMMTHELRTPLNAVIGFSDIMRQELLGPVGNDQYKAYLQDVYASSNHLLEIINDILDIAKVEAGEMELREENLKLDVEVAFCQRTVEDRARKGGLDIGVDLPDDLPRLRADSRKLRQILLNLLSNGVKFTPEGGRVTVSAAVGPDGAMTLRVSDTGIGIAESNISVALEPFRQIDSRLSRKYDGTGLGLPLVMALAELHGAELRLESVEGEGTTASVRFPPERTVTAIAARLPAPLAQSATG